MAAPETRRVFEALTVDGAQARFVGGCVRDSLLRRAVKDIDIATDAEPERVIRLLEAARIRAIPTGIDHDRNQFHRKIRVTIDLLQSQ